MFHIFTKKRFLVDALHGFVDIHNHILPGIDDGAKTVEDSIAMIREFGSFGVTNFVATPHIMNDYYPNTPETIKASYSLLKNELIKEGLSNISLDTAAEHMIDGTFENLLEKGDIMPLRLRHLLIEMSYIQPALNFKEAVVKTANAKYFPILAHPERYVYLHAIPNVYQHYKTQGVLFQLNLLSLGGYYGKRIFKMANFLLDQGIIDYVGTDVHHLKHLKALQEVQLNSKVWQQLQPVIRNTIQTFY